MQSQDLSNFNQSIEITRWVCPGKFFYIGCSLIGCGIIYSKSWIAEKLILNIFLAFGYAILAFWGHEVLQQFDVAFWFAILTVANIAMFCHGLDDYIDSLKGPTPATLPLYDMLFAPMNVDMKTFKQLISCSSGVQTIEANDLFAAEGQRNAGNELSVLLSGRLIATQHDQVLHVILPGQFMDSPEWEAFDPRNTKHFRVTIVAEENSTYITWHRSNIEKLMKRNKYLTHMMNLIIGRDIAYKLYNTEASLWSPLNTRDLNLTSKVNNIHNSSNARPTMVSTYSNGGAPVVSLVAAANDELPDESVTTPFSSAESKQSPTDV